jgi:phosphoserine aminotransferase
MKHNFNPGPSILPQPVFKEAAEAVLDFNNSGLSILEISHRSPDFIAVMAETKELVKELLGIGDGWQILFLTGGASTQFFMTAMNLLGKDATAHYIDTGTWSKKAIKEATRLSGIDVVASSSDMGYTYIPKDIDIPADGKYLHLTSNNTIFGTQFHTWPETDLPIVADMSSDIFSRPLDMSRFGLIYCGAQKNLGPAGMTLVIIRDEFLADFKPDIPTMLDYRTHIDKDSSFNTPPVFPIYVAMLTLRWLKANGGLSAMADRNTAKAKLLYDEIDENPDFKGVVMEEDRSAMNVTFALSNPDLEPKFLEMCNAAGIVGIKGHRSVGGFRASMYNAMPIESVRALVNVMEQFSSAYGQT